MFCELGTSAFPFVFNFVRHTSTMRTHCLCFAAFGPRRPRHPLSLLVPGGPSDKLLPAAGRPSGGNTGATMTGDSHQSRHASGVYADGSSIPAYSCSASRNVLNASEMPTLRACRIKFRKSVNAQCGLLFNIN